MAEKLGTPPEASAKLGVGDAVMLLTAFLFAVVMFVTFDLAFDVIMPKGPLEAAFGY